MLALTPSVRQMSKASSQAVCNVCVRSMEEGTCGHFSHPSCTLWSKIPTCASFFFSLK